MSEPRWIRFVEVPVPDRKTRCWRVESKEGVGVLLGGIEWYGPWRKYVFGPTAEYDTVYEETCLRDIAAFVEARTSDHRAALRAKKAATP